MSYTIRKSTLADLPVILNLRDQAREIMRSYGNTFQWPDGYPRDDMFLRDIEVGGSHVMLDERGEVVGTFALLPSPEVTYNVIYDGQWLDDEPYHVIHRIASTPDFGRRLGLLRKPSRQHPHRHARGQHHHAQGPGKAWVSILWHYLSFGW